MPSSTLSSTNLKHAYKTGKKRRRPRRKKKRAGRGRADSRRRA